jgi:hypothetical protein
VFFIQFTLKNQIITGEDDVEDRLTEVWANVIGDLVQSVFYGWIARLEWISEHEGEYQINSH